MFTFEEYYYYRVIVYNTTNNINSQKRSPSTNESYPYSSFIIHHYEIGVQESTLSIPTKLRHEMPPTPAPNHSYSTKKTDFDATSLVLHK